MSKRFQFNANDLLLVRAATTLLKKVAAAETTRPAALVSVAKLLHVFSALPNVTPGVEVTVSVSSPRRNFSGVETWHWRDVAAEGEQLSISTRGHIFQPDTGGDTFTTMTWAAVPGEPTELNDYRATLWMVPDVQSFPDGVTGIDLSFDGYKVEVTDSDNPLLEEHEVEEQDAEEDSADETFAESGDDESQDDAESEPWSISPIGSAEEQLALTVDHDEVESHEPRHAHGIAKCDFCRCPLNDRGLFVDGRLRDDLMWGNMCAACFAVKGEGIGWGNGQLYARQPDGTWRMVAGWMSADARN